MYLELQCLGVGNVNSRYLLDLLPHLVRHIVTGAEGEGQGLREPALHNHKQSNQRTFRQ